MSDVTNFTQAPPTGREVDPAYDWGAALGAAHDDHKNLIETKGWATPADALSSYVHLERLIGSDSVALPVEGAPTEQWDAFHQAAGRPDLPEGYQFVKPEGFALYDDGAADWYRQAAHAAGLSQRQATALHDAFVGFTGQQGHRAEAEQQQTMRGAEQALRAEYGAALEEKVALARRAASRFASDTALEKLDQLVGGAELVQMFVKIGETMSESRLHGQSSGGFRLTPDQAQQRIQEFEQSDAYRQAAYDRADPRHNEVIAEMQRLFELAYPEPGR